MFRSRASKIKGVSGTLDGRRVLIADAATGAGPGITRVVAAAGAHVAAATETPPTLDVQIARIQSPVPIAPFEFTRDRPGDLLSTIKDSLDAAVLNPDLASHASIEAILEIGSETASSMLDRGYGGSIVLITGINRSGAEGANASLLQAAMEDMAADLAPNGIRVNSVAPGPVGANRRDNPVSHRATPLGHVAVHPVEVGKAVWFLLNDAMSAGVTGATLRVDRGASLVKPSW